MSKRRNSSHNKAVSGILALALAVTAVISTAQLAGVSNNLSASVSGRYVAIQCSDGTTVPDGQTCPPPAGGGGGTTTTTTTTTDTFACNALNGSVVSRATCDDADARKNACVSPSTWNSTGSGSCTAGTTTTTTTTTGTCPAGQITCGNGSCATTQASCPTTTTGTQTCSGGTPILCSNGTCAATQASCPTTTTGSCPAGQITCSNGSCATTQASCPTTTTGTCPAGTPYRCSDNSCAAASTSCPTTTTTTTTADTVGACQGRGGVWSAGSSTCSIAPGGGTGTGTCPTSTPYRCSDNSCAATSASCPTTTTNTTTTDTVGACQGRGGVWSAGSSTCSIAPGGTGTGTGTCPAGQVTCGNGSCAATYASCPTTTTMTTTGCGYNQYWDGASCVQYTNTATTNLNTQLNTGAGFFCGSAGKMVTSGPECNCYDHGGTWSGSTCTSATGGTVDTTTRPMFDPLAATGTQCGQGQYFDFATRACKAQFNQDAVFGEDLYDTFECPEWDTRCQEHQEGGEFSFDNFAWQQGGDCSSSQIRGADLEGQLEDLQQQFSSISLGNATDSYATVSTKAQLDALSTMNFGDADQACQAFNFFEDFDANGIRGAQELSQFRRELEKIQSECDYEKTRITNVTALGYLDACGEVVAELYANPPLNEAEPRKLWDSLFPACMRPDPADFTGTGGSGGGGMGFTPNFGPMCTPEELVADSTPRGYLDAARMLDSQGVRDRFSGDMCQNAARHIAIFENTVLPQLSGTAKTKAENLIARGKALAIACQNTAERERFALMQQFEAIGREAEALIQEAGIDFDEFGSEGRRQFDLGGINQLIGSDLADLINQLIADAVKTATGEMLAQLAANGFESRILEQIAMAMNSFTGAIADKVSEGLGGVLEVFSYLPEESTGVASEITEVTSEILQTLDVTSQAYPDSEGDVEDCVEDLVEIGPLPLAILGEIEEQVEDAVILAENGADPTEPLQACRDIIGDLDLEELNDQRIADGTWYWDDVSYENEIWGGEANQYLIRAKSELNLSGTENEDGQYDFEASKTLNVCEGLTMMAKTMGFEGEATPSTEIIEIVGDATWAGGFLQEIADEVGVNEVSEIATEAGGCGGAMDRAAFAHMGSELADSAGVDVSINPDSEIGHYTDYEQMTAEEQSDFAFAHYIGMIEGADGGTLANPQGDAIRLEAAKMLTEFRAAAQEAAVTGGESASTTSASFEQLFGEDLVNLGVEDLSTGDPSPGDDVSSGDPGSGITE